MYKTGVSGMRNNGKLSFMSYLLFVDPISQKAEKTIAVGRGNHPYAGTIKVQIQTPKQNIADDLAEFKLQLVDVKSNVQTPNDDAEGPPSGPALQEREGERIQDAAWSVNNITDIHRRCCDWACMSNDEGYVLAVARRGWCR